MLSYFKNAFNVYIFLLLWAYNFYIDCKALDSNKSSSGYEFVIADNLFNNLPLDNALKEVHGKGELKIAIFTDIYCPYCRKLKKILDEVDNITIYNFIIPFLNSKNNFENFVRIWCSGDRLKLWNDVMYSKLISIPDVKICKNPIKENISLFYSLDFYSVPVMIFPSGYYYNDGVVNKDLLINMIKENQ